MKNGKGKFYYLNGNIYTGDFMKDLKHGKGRMFYANGSM